MKKANRFRSADNIYMGAFLGLVFPVVGFLLYYLLMFFDTMSLSTYWDFLFREGNISAALSLSIIANLAIFFYFINSSMYEASKGIVGATIFYGLFIIIFKFF
ncbi:MAG: hypothetical protein LH473_05835 [Chitinophagales bacterium]|nr:hypothetical protein [Chitinophagales bacterium]